MALIGGGSGLGTRGIRGSGSVIGEGKGIVTPAGGFDPDAQAYFDAVEAAGGTLNTTQKDAWNTFVVTLKSESLYSRAKFMLPKMGGVIDACEIDATGNITPLANAAFVDADCDATYGLTGQNATAKRIDLGVNAATLFEGQFDWTLGVDLLTSQTTASAYAIGSAAGSFFQTIRILNTGGRIIGYGNTSTIAADSNPTALTAGHVTLVKRANNDLELYNNATSIRSNTTLDTGALTSIINLYEFAENAVNSTDDSKHGLSYCFNALSDAEVSTLHTALTQFKTDLGV